MHPEYNLALALEDFLPVALSSIGLFFLAQLAARMAHGLSSVRWLGLLGAWLGMLGGGVKAAWKLNLTLTGNNISWMDNQLFFLLGAGFTCLAWAFIAGRRLSAGKPVKPLAWLIPLAIVAVFYVTGFYVRSAYPNVRWWIFILLGLTTLANLTLVGVCIRQALAQKQRLVALLFVLNIVAVFALQGFARIGDRSLFMQWIEQIVNTVGTGAFAYAAIVLGRTPEPRRAEHGRPDR